MVECEADVGQTMQSSGHFAYVGLPLVCRITITFDRLLSIGGAGRHIYVRLILRTVS